MYMQVLDGDRSDLEELLDIELFDYNDTDAEYLRVILDEDVMAILITYHLLC